ncbi:gamma-aminobutyric acid type B receptor subunit 2-like [Gigantopelta aegis]|uniref:gamma-aminobutyric acid type B receptor subunit 2-like n=1 Tax=Gigantopelta aegis TaxID=1735272 RepID=UPI001B88AC4B|nr:gamma-aminobutyric acid type B receptor subunit 2-like [Gigantopelta aegis]
MEDWRIENNGLPICRYGYTSDRRRQFCSGEEAFKIRFGGPRIVWLLPGFFKARWWDVNDTDCSGNEILSVLGNYFAVEVFSKPDLHEQDDNGLTLQQFMDDYNKKVNYTEPPGYEWAQTGYDTLWAIARALNATMADLENTEFGLEDFSYTNKDIGDLIKNNMGKVDFSSITGHVSFYPNGDSTKVMKIEQLQDKKMVIVGRYNPLETVPNRLHWIKSVPVIWPNGVVPRDSVKTVYKSIQVSPPVYISMCVLAAFGILLDIIFLTCNIKYRKTRIIKMSSPDINNIILLGCIVVYSFVFFYGHNIEKTPVLCKGLNQFLLVGWRVWSLSNTAIQNIPEVFYGGHVWGACRPRQYVYVVGSKEVLYDSGCMRSGVVLLKNDTTWLPLEKWYCSWTKNVIPVTLSCQVSVNDDQWCPFLCTDTSPHHDTPSTIWHDLLNARSRHSFSPTAVHTLSSINSEQTEPAFISEKNPQPITSLPTSYSPSPCQSQKTMLWCQ